MHTPEFSFERDAAYVRRAVPDLGIDYPFSSVTLRGLGRVRHHYWPALYFSYAQGRIPHHHFGEGEYQQSEMVIQRLLAEASSPGAAHA